MKVALARRAVASVVGTIFFVVVFMLALGSMAYAYGLQEQTNESQEQGLLAASARGSEVLRFVLTQDGLVASNGGPATVEVNHIILKFPNGTVYLLPASAEIPSAGEIGLLELIPGGICHPGGATCASKYAEIVSGNPAGSSVGLVTSLGNVFWFTFRDALVGWGSIDGFPAPCPSGEAVSALNYTLACSPGPELSSWLSAPATATVTDGYSGTGLGVVLPSNGTFAFYALTAIEPSLGVERYNFEVGALPAGASLVIACAPMAIPEGGGNAPTNCVTSTETPMAAPNSLGFGVTPPVYATPGLFGVVRTGPESGVLELDFACTQNCGGVTILAGSFMLVQSLG